MMTKLAKVHKLGGKLSVEFSVVYMILDGPHFSLFKTYVVFLGSNKVSMLINDCKDALMKVNESIWTDVKVLILIFIDSILLLYIITNTYLLM